jgi:hypothetical protein
MFRKEGTVILTRRLRLKLLMKTTNKSFMFKNDANCR